MFYVEKLTNPKEQVGLRNTQKWAVMSTTLGFVDAFRTKRAAENFMNFLHKIQEGAASCDSTL